MAHVERRVLPSGQVRYRARYRDPTGRERTRAFDRRGDAQRFLNNVEADKSRGQWLDPKAGRVTFREYAEAWQAAQLHRPQTRASVAVMIRLHMLPAFGSRPLAAIRPTECRALVRDLSTRLAPSTVATIHRWLSVILKAAVEDQIIVRNPAAGTAPPRPPRRAVEVLTAEQVAALVREAPDRYRAMILLALGTGLRQGECFGLSLAAPGRPGLDLLRRRVEVVRQVSIEDGRSFVTTDLKTRASRRTVPLPPSLVAALAEHLAAFPVSRDDGVIFTAPRGGLLRRKHWGSQVWRPMCDRAGLPGSVGFHWLRHQFASTMIAGGASLVEVQHLLGHASITETAGTYAHLLPDAEDITRDRMEAVYRKAVEG